MNFIATEDQPACPTFLDFFINNENYKLTPMHASFGKSFVSDGTRSSGHKHKIYHIVIFNKSCSKYIYNNKVIAALENDLVLVSPGENHEFSPAVKGKLYYSEFSFTLNNSKGEKAGFSFEYLLNRITIQKIKITENPVKLNKSFAELLNLQLCELLKNLKSNTPFSWNSSYRLIFNILNHISDFYAESEKVINEYDRLEVAKQEIERYYTDGICLDRLSDLATISKEHLIRKFKKKYGDTPKSYQINLKINAAIMLLKNSGLRIKEIAARCGFSDVYSFSKTFKKRTGYSPGIYRKTMNPKNQ